MNSIEQAASILRAGGLVAFPTETVYGLGADATNSTAVEKIFKAKGRPPTNPLIVHVANAAVAMRYVSDWPGDAEQLARAFWPGPLTLVLPKADNIVSQTTAGGATVGLRVPNHPIALRLLREFDGPVAAPSANKSNHISPTTAEHVRHEFGSEINLILDGGSCDVGIESTVINLASATPIILRPGHITKEQIESIIGPVKVFHGNADPETAAQSPGQQARHYAPRTPAYRFERDQLPTDCKDAVIIHLPGKPISEVLQRVGPIVKTLKLSEDPSIYARQLYSALREADSQSPRVILIQLPPATEQWLAVRDRIIRATEPV